MTATLDKPAQATSVTPADAHRAGSWMRIFFQPIDIGLIVFFRVAFGLLMLYEMSRFIRNDWIRTLFIEPKLHFTFYGFGWVRPWPGDGMYWHFGILAVLAVMIAVGLFYRTACILFFLGITQVFLIEQALYLNHMYLICLMSFLMIFLPANRSLSLDAKWKPEIRSQTVPIWTLWILRFQIGVAYVYGGIAKLNADWFNLTAIRGLLNNSWHVPIVGSHLDEDWMLQFFVWGGLLFDLMIVPALMWKKTRVPAYFGCIFFHAMNAQLFQIGVFPIFMIAATMMFFPADSLSKKRDIEPDKKKKRRKRPTPEPAPAPVIITPARRLLVAGLILYVAIQVLVPFRHFLYPGNVHWTEEGHRFSWHMKLRVKRAEATFTAKDKDGNAIDLSDFEGVLTDRQASRMPGRPDMVLQYAHYLRDRLHERGYEEVSIYVDSKVELNGRDPKPMIDPQADLAKEERTLKHVDWVLPFEE